MNLMMAKDGDHVTNIIFWLGIITPFIGVATVFLNIGDAFQNIMVSIFIMFGLLMLWGNRMFL